MVSLWQIFGVFAKIGTFTIGGGYAMSPIIEDELKRRNWIDPEEIGDVVVLAQSAPGLLAVNMAPYNSRDAYDAYQNPDCGYFQEGHQKGRAEHQKPSPPFIVPLFRHIYGRNENQRHRHRTDALKYALNDKVVLK